MTPLVLHDLQDAQIFALAQAAGRAGLVVDGMGQPLEPWMRASRYVRHIHEVPSLPHLTRSLYAWYLRGTGLSGVWLPCTEEVAAFTVRYRGLLEKMGLGFLAPDEDAFRRAARREAPEVAGLVRPFSAWMRMAQLLGEEGASLPYPLFVRPGPAMARRVEHHAALMAFLRELGGERRPEAEVHVQADASGESRRLAAAIVLADGRGRAVRVFTARLLRVAQEGFGVVRAARAERIPELAEAACMLAEALAWRGFLALRANQTPDGRWHLLDLCPYLPADVAVLAEADGAGLVRAYHALVCDASLRLSCAALQRGQAEYRRMLATAFYPPDWAVPAVPGESWLRRGMRFVRAFGDAWRAPERVCLGAWDRRDLRASLAVVGRTLHNVWRHHRHGAG